MSDAARAGTPARARVALDAMGGDDAPATTVAGAIRASADGVDVVLVGDGERLGVLLASAGADLPVVHAAEHVGMEEDPALALRAKPRASIRVAAAEVAAGRADALVSAGSTGATLAAALLELGRVPGVRRPAVAAVLPGGAILLDGGASADVQPDALPGFAAMGAAWARVRGVAQPRVGLLNVGAEPGKGSAFARAAHAALAAGPVAGWVFAGNIEPAAILAGDVDVVVTDGFTGNVLLKALEAAGAADASGAGAALLLGCAHPVLVAHGDAGVDELAAALRTADEVARGDLVHAIAASLPPTARRAEPARG